MCFAVIPISRVFLELNLFEERGITVQRKFINLNFLNARKKENDQSLTDFRFDCSRFLLPSNADNVERDTRQCDEHAHNALPRTSDESEDELYRRNHDKNNWNWQRHLKERNFKSTRAKTKGRQEFSHFIRARLVRSRPSKIQKNNNGKANGSDVDESSVVNKNVQIRVCEVE